MLAKPSKTYCFGLVSMSLQKTKAFRAIVFDLALVFLVNPLDSKSNYDPTSNNTKLVHWPLMHGLLH